MDGWMDGTYCCCVWENRIHRGFVGGGGGSVDDEKPPALVCRRGCEGERAGETCRSVQRSGGKGHHDFDVFFGSSESKLRPA